MLGWKSRPAAAELSGLVKLWPLRASVFSSVKKHSPSPRHSPCPRHRENSAEPCRSNWVVLVLLGSVVLEHQNYQEKFSKPQISKAKSMTLEHPEVGSEHLHFFRSLSNSNAQPHRAPLC